MFTPPECAYFAIGNFPIYYYGITLAFAIFVGVLISNKIAIKEYFMPQIIPNIATSVIIGGIIGARLYYCVLNWGHYFNNPIEVLALREGGLSIHGAILGGVIVLYYQAKRNNIELLKLCDICAMGMPIAQAIGRWGNFFNSEAFGLPTGLPWKMFVRQPLRPDKYFYNDYFHPTFLYEALLNVLIFIVLYKVIMPKYKEKAGLITAYYLLLYSIVRFFIEYLRLDCVKYVLGVPVPQLVSAVVIIVTGYIIIRANKKAG